MVSGSKVAVTQAWGPELNLSTQVKTQAQRHTAVNPAIIGGTKDKHL